MIDQIRDFLTPADDRDGPCIAVDAFAANHLCWWTGSTDLGARFQSQSIADQLPLRHDRVLPHYPEPGANFDEPMKTAFFYVLAAFAELAGCFSFWAWLRLDRSPLWLVPGMTSLALFAWALTRVDSDAAGRAYAAYGAVYICASLVWLWVAEGIRPGRFDILGAAVCVAGAGIILAGSRTVPA